MLVDALCYGRTPMDTVVLYDPSMTGEALQTLHDPEPAGGSLYSNKRAKLGEKELAKFREMYLAGEPTPTICRTLSISQTSVSNYARRLNLPLRSKRPPLTEPQLARLRELYFAGVISDKICQELNINPPALVRYIEQMGLPGRKRAGSGQPRHPNGKLSEEEVATFRKMYETTMPLVEICAHLSISISTVYRYAEKLGLRRIRRARRSRPEQHSESGS